MRRMRRRVGYGKVTTGDWVWKDEEDEEDELANQFNATMHISTKRR
jgi:hypothetical protein